VVADIEDFGYSYRYNQGKTAARKAAAEKEMKEITGAMDRR